MRLAMLRATCLAAVCVTLPAAGLAQAVSGTLLGTVTDASGAAVPNAQITITATETHQTQTFKTNESGNYLVPGVQPGNYTISVEAQGFKRELHENVAVASNSTVRIDAAMATGAVTEQVTVSTAPPVLQTDRADISTQIEREQVADLPLGTNRNFQSLLNLVPGTQPATYEHSQFFNAQGALQTRANGIPRMGNLYQIEGIDDDERTGLLQIIIPPAEAIQSVSVSTNNFDAELGRAIGAVTNVTLRSGTNAIHGSAFEFIQNNAVNARSYFGGPLGHLAYNYFGGSLGGPIIKNKLFIFGDYLRTTDREKVNNVLTIVPTQFYTDNGNGFVDLSAPGLAKGKAANGTFNTGQVYDPNTGNADGSGRTPFLNNLVPVSRLNKVTLGLLRGLPAPNQNTSNIASPSNNYNANLPFSKNTNSFDIKADYTLSQKDHLSGRYSYQKVNTFQAPVFGSFLGGPGGGGGFEATGVQTGYSTGANLEHSFSNTLFTEVRFGVAHLRNNAQPSDYGSNDAATAGIPGVNIPGNLFTTGQVGITVNGGFSNPQFGYSASVPWIRGESNIDFVNNWTKTLKNHSIKFGGDVRRVRDDLLQDQTFSPRGAYTFGENQTSILGGSTNVANDVASFLLDVPSQAGRDLNTFFPAYRQTWIFAFVSDKWQVNQKLTLDLGIRWEFYPAATPRKSSGFSNYDFANNQLLLAGVGNIPADLGIKTRYKYFAPRTGLSYRASDSTVVRMGFGMSYLPFPDNTYAYNYPVRANNSFNPATTYGPAVIADGVTTATFQAGFPAPVAIPIPANGIIPIVKGSVLNSSSFTIIPTNFFNPYVMSWNVAVQQALPYDMSLQLAYVANHGVHMPVAQNLNLPSFLGGGPTSDPQNLPGGFGRTAASTAQFLGFSSNYQSLQAQLNKRFSKGLSFTTAFTWGKSLNYQSGDDGGLQFFAQLRRNYAVADFDRKFNFENSFTYELPAGRGHRYFSSGPSQFALGGWKLSGIVSAVSGLPFTVNANGGSLNTPGVTQTANLVAPFRKIPGHNTIGVAYFDPASFGQPVGNGVTGNTGRNQFIGPGFVQNSLTIFKQFPIFREANLETRFEAFQLSNTPQFANPQAGTFGNANYGFITGTVGSGQGSVNGVGGGRSLQASVKLQF